MQKKTRPFATTAELECAKLEASIKLSTNPDVKGTLTTKLDLHKQKAKISYKQLKRKTALEKKKVDTESLFLLILDRIFDRRDGVVTDAMV